MSSRQLNSGTGRFFVKQTILLAITIALMVFFTIPLMKAVKAALSPRELETSVDRSQQEVAGLETRLDVVRSKMLMGAGDDEAQEKLRKEVEELKRQVVAKEVENKNLQDQMALVRTMLEVLKAKPAAAPVPVVDDRSQVLRSADQDFRMYWFRVYWSDVSGFVVEEQARTTAA